MEVNKVADGDYSPSGVFTSPPLLPTASTTATASALSQAISQAVDGTAAADVLSAEFAGWTGCASSATQQLINESLGCLPVSPGRPHSRTMSEFSLKAKDESGNTSPANERQIALSDFLDIQKKSDAAVAADSSSFSSFFETPYDEYDNSNSQQNFGLVQQHYAFNTEQQQGSCWVADCYEEGVVHDSQWDVKARHRSQFYKTRLCPTFRDSGTCRRGSKCNYAHSREEMQPEINL